jgi:hypothetical protein
MANAEERARNGLISEEKILETLKEKWDFDALIAPYKEGGKEDRPIERTWGTMIDWLINKRKYPPDIVGASIFLVWMRIKQDGHIPPDYTRPDPKADPIPIYGSAGRKFAHAVAGVCGGLMKQKVVGSIFSDMAGSIESRIKTAFRNDTFILMPWFVKMFSRQYWKHRSEKKLQAKAE